MRDLETLRAAERAAWGTLQRLGEQVACARAGAGVYRRATVRAVVREDYRHALAMWRAAREAVDDALLVERMLGAPRPAQPVEEAPSAA